MARVALVETKPSRTDFKREFDGAFEFDQYQLCSDPTIKKVLKRDCDIDFDDELYDWVVLVGSDALKYFTKITNIIYASMVNYSQDQRSIAAFGKVVHYLDCYSPSARTSC